MAPFRSSLLTTGVGQSCPHAGLQPFPFVEVPVKVLSKELLLRPGPISLGDIRFGKPCHGAVPAPASLPLLAVRLSGVERPRASGLCL